MDVSCHCVVSVSVVSVCSVVSRQSTATERFPLQGQSRTGESSEWRVICVYTPSMVMATSGVYHPSPALSNFAMKLELLPAFLLIRSLKNNGHLQVCLLAFYKLPISYFICYQFNF